MLPAACWMLDARCWTLNAACCIACCTTGGGVDQKCWPQKALRAFLGCHVIVYPRGAVTFFVLALQLLYVHPDYRVRIMSGGPKAPSINVFHTMCYLNSALLSQ